MWREQRLTRRADFADVYNEGKSWANRLVVVRARPNGLENSRLAFVAGKRVGNAVVRNRLKRLLRESVRTMSLQPGWDVVLIARGAAAQASYHQLKKALEQLLWRVRIRGGEATQPSQRMGNE